MSAQQTVGASLFAVSVFKLRVKKFLYGDK